MEIFLIRYWNIFITVTSEQSFVTKTASNTIEVVLYVFITFLAFSQCNFAPSICFMLASIPTFG